MHKALFTWFLSLSVLTGGAYTVLHEFGPIPVHDPASYMKMAQGDYKVTITHRYRFIIPALAGVLNRVVAKVYGKIWQNRDPQKDWPLCFSFFIVEIFIMAFIPVVLYRINTWYGVGFTATIVGILAFLTSRWAFYISGAPSVDSLYILMVSLLAYGVICSQKWAIVVALIIGPISKEAFLLFYPLVFIRFKKKDVWFLMGMILLSFIPFLSSRYFIDQHFPLDHAGIGINNALNHIENIEYSLSRIFSIKGAGMLFFVFGFLAIALCWIKREDIIKLHPFLWGMLPVVAFQMLLSSDVDRMFYVAAPLLVLLISMGIDRLFSKYNMLA